jgi:hypothetical protein
VKPWSKRRTPQPATPTPVRPLVAAPSGAADDGDLVAAELEALFRSGTVVAPAA